MTQIHATAIIHSDAEVDEKVVIGPYCCVGKDVKLGKDVQLLSHVVIEGHTSIGDGTRVFPFATILKVLGFVPYGGEGENSCPISDAGVPFNNYMRQQLHVFT
jgi:UDP-N-acetylglucosamine acyltransferase